MPSRIEELEHDGDEVPEKKSPAPSEPNLSGAQEKIARRIDERKVRRAAERGDPIYCGQDGTIFHGPDGPDFEDDGFFFGEEQDDPTLTQGPINARYKDGLK